METSHIMNALGRWPRPDCIHLTSIHTDAIGSNNITQKGHLMCVKGALFKVAKEFLLFKNSHDLGEVVLVLFLILTIDQNVVKIDHHKMTNGKPKHLVHEPHKSTRGVGKAEWHD